MNKHDLSYRCATLLNELLKNLPTLSHDFRTIKPAYFRSGLEYIKRYILIDIPKNILFNNFKLSNTVYLLQISVKVRIGMYILFMYS